MCPFDHESSQNGSPTKSEGTHGLEIAEVPACDWHTIDDACICGEALLDADRKRMNRTRAMGLDETSFG
jgi:hypothetical protein